MPPQPVSGAKLKLTSEFSIKAEYQHQFDLSDSAEDSDVAKIGFNWHP